MQRWFYANEELICHKIKASHLTEDESSSEPLSKGLERTWRFCVSLKDRELLPNEAIALSGDCESLGNWQFDACVLMTPMREDKLDMWHVYVNIPAERDVAYRYLIVAVDPERDQMIVRFFESHLKPRKAKKSAAVVDVCDDIFGFVDDIEKVERGWLTTERIVQFMFFHAPFKWKQPEMAECTYHVKVTPYFRKIYDKCDKTSIREDMSMFVQSFFGDIESDSNEQIKEDDIENKRQSKQPLQCGQQEIPSYTNLNFCDSVYKNAFIEHVQCDSINSDSIENDDVPTKQESIKLSTAFAFNEAANVFQSRCDLKRQPRFGTQCGKDDLVMMHLTIGDFENTVYLVELFLYHKNINKDEYPHLLGYRYLEPEDFKTYENGYIEAPIICASKHRQLGSMKIRFLIILPHPTLKFNLSVSYLRHWNRERGAIDIGHRGQGKSYNTSDDSIVYENTLYSLNKAIENGANMVEFDVHLTKDLIPVIYHDFNIHLAKHDSTLLQNFDNINVPIYRFDYEGLQNLNILNSKACNDEELQISIAEAPPHQQLFPKLSDILHAVNENIAFNIEIKWPQQFCNIKWEDDVHPSINPNVYVDQILEIVMPNARKRRIVFTCFDADICTLLRFKQNIYPVMLIIRNELEMPYVDPRTRPASTAANFAYTMELLGVVPHANTLLKSPSFIAKSCPKELIVFSYGIEDHKHIEELKKAGVSAVIFDRMDKFNESRKGLSVSLAGGGGGGDGGDE